MMFAIDLFSGVGGLSLGFKLSGFEILYANEYDQSIAESYKKNHHETNVDNRSILDINLSNTFKKYKNKIDIVIGGPPCQGFSQKGSRKGLGDDRNYLFKSFVSVIAEVKPNFFLMENVPNIITTNQGYFIKEIELLFSQLGYKIYFDTLMASDYGIPQNRKRAFILGSKKSINFKFPNKENKKVSVSEAIDDLPILKSGENYDKKIYTIAPKNNYQKEMRKNSSIIYNHESTLHSKTTLERLSLIKIGNTRNDLPDHHKTKSIYSGTWQRLDPHGQAPTITTRFDTPSSGQFTLPYQDRCLTVREAARIQSFPDNFIFYGKKNSQMIQVGNAVPPKLAHKIAKEIKNYL